MAHSGIGIFKSEDGGKSFVCKGLEDSHLVTPNEPNGLTIYYYLKYDIPDKNISIEVVDEKNRKIIIDNVSHDEGIHKINIQNSILKPGNYKVNLFVGTNNQEKKVKIPTDHKWSVGNVYGQ